MVDISNIECDMTQLSGGELRRAWRRISAGKLFLWYDITLTEDDEIIFNNGGTPLICKKLNSNKFIQFINFGGGIFENKMGDEACIQIIQTYTMKDNLLTREKKIHSIINPHKKFIPRLFPDAWIRDKMPLMRRYGV